MNNDTLFAAIDDLTERGQLRRLSGAFARFIGSIGNHSPQLMVACALLSELEGRGHSCLLLSELAGDPSGLLGWNPDDWRLLREAVAPWPKNAAAWRTLLAAADQVWPVGDLDFQQPLVLDGERLYLRRYWRDEHMVAHAIKSRAEAKHDAPDAALVKRWLDKLFDHTRGATNWQKVACAIAIRGKLGIITGGPGTGKTYTVARLLALLFACAGTEQEGLRIALAAPTGKAAARLKQSIDQALDQLDADVGGELPLRRLASQMGAARTLHSLLGAHPDSRAFKHNAGNQLDVDVLIVDEASMIHLEMMASLLAALPSSATLILLGDKDQLASVEAGAVLGDLCHGAQAGNYSAETIAYVQEACGEAIPEEFAASAGRGGAVSQQTVMLRESRRFGGPIGALAQAVNVGDAPRSVAVLRGEAVADAAQASEPAPVAWTDPAQASDVLRLAMAGYGPTMERIKTGPGDMPYAEWVLQVLKSFEGFRLLCAVREGEWGVSGLNESIEQRLQKAELIRRGGEWYVGRPVMITRNDYGTGVFNGDIGLTLPDPARPGALRVYFAEGNVVRSVLATRLRNVETAYAMTVHKSQGSEFSHTVLALPRDGGGMLARELIYTGITRARIRFTLLTPNAQVLLEAINQRTQRASGLRELL
jgi:exodeoxyribonuclease V alpha subunit